MTKKKNILVLTYWTYHSGLIQSYTLPYIKIIQSKLPKGSKVFLLTIEQGEHGLEGEELKQVTQNLAKNDIELITLKYTHFGVKMFFRLVGLLFRLRKTIQSKQIQFIHAWCTPAGALGYLLSIFTKKPLILDSYEPHAESMVENGTWKASSIRYKLLFWLEKKQSQRAKTVIGLTQGMPLYAKEKYGVTLQDYHVKPALVNLEKFNFSSTSYSSNRNQEGIDSNTLVCLYAGKIGGIYLTEELFDFFKVAANHWNDRLKIYLLTDCPKNEVEDWLKRKKINPEIVVTQFVPYAEIHYYFSLADFAINPVKPVSSKRYCTSIKDGEYWASGLPVVITDQISDDSDIISEERIGYVLKSLTIEEYSKACMHIDKMMEKKSEWKEKIREIATKYRSFEIAECVYQNIYAE